VEDQPIPVAGDEEPNDACQNVNPSWAPAVQDHVGMTLEPASYPRHRFPAEIIRHAVWLYHVFSLSPHDVELILAERGTVRPMRTSGTGA
jgi:hypothetical protein